ncbi:MAG: phasin family protein [Pseudomonadota bacterium]
MPTRSNQNKSAFSTPFAAFDMKFFPNAETMFFTAAHMNSYAIKSLAQYNLEALRFFQHRLEEDVKMADNLSRCRTFSDMRDTLESFCKTAVDEYSDEAGKLSGLGTDLAKETAGRVQEEAAKAARTEH